MRPASVVTYEPQWNSDVNTIMENVYDGRGKSGEPADGLPACGRERRRRRAFDQIDWEESTRTDYKEKYFRAPKALPETQKGLSEKWVAYAKSGLRPRRSRVAARRKGKACR
jgi:hypothetical protein